MRWETEFSFAQTRAAAELARSGTLAHPGCPGNWLVLSHALERLGEFPEAIACVREAITLSPQSAKLHARLAEILCAQDRLEEALPHVEMALRIMPDDRRLTQRRFTLLALLGDREKLDSERVADLSARNVHLMKVRTESLDPPDILELCNALLGDQPGHTYARYLKALTLARLGRADEARGLIAIDRLIEIQELAVPGQYADERSFRETLAREILADPTLQAEPRGYTTRDGSKTRTLRRPGAVAVDVLLGQIRRAVDAYEERLAASGDAFAAWRPRKARLHAWGVVYGGGGRQTAHVHPGGWLSGVYYVSAPRPNGDNAYRGPLVIGVINSRKHGVAPPWGTREIEPVPGRLVMFPSYVPHATRPPGGEDGARICVSFDVVDAA